MNAWTQLGLLVELDCGARADLLTHKRSLVRRDPCGV